MVLDAQKEQILQRAEQANRIYIYPTSLRRSDAQVRNRFANLAAVRQELHRQLSDFPITLLRLLAEHPRGQIVLTPTGAEYDHRIAVAQIGIRYLADATGVVQEEVTPLLDHLLGSSGLRARMSEGHGINQPVAELGKQLKTWYDVKRDSYYDRYAARNEREFLAQAVRKYLYLPGLLRANDLEMFEFVRDRFLNEDFWKGVF